MSTPTERRRAALAERRTWPLPDRIRFYLDGVAGRLPADPERRRLMVDATTTFLPSGWFTLVLGTVMMVFGGVLIGSGRADWTIWLIVLVMGVLLVGAVANTVAAIRVRAAVARDGGIREVTEQ